MGDSAERIVAQRRPWGTLDRDQIVEAALRIARRDGLQALSIRRLASELDASRMALYSHVSSKAALLELTAHAIAEQDLPLPKLDGGNWEAQLRALVAAVRKSLRRYPGLAELLLVHGNTSPAALAVADHCLAIFRRAGMNGRDAVLCYVALIDVVLGRVQRETAAGRAGPERRLRGQLDAVRAAGPETLPEFHRALNDFTAIRSDEVADIELDLLIAGFREKAAVRRRRSSK